MSHYSHLFPTDEAERSKSEGHPFVLPDLWRASSLSSEAPGTGSMLFSFNFSPSPAATPPPPRKSHETVFHMPSEFKLPPMLPNFGSSIWPIPPADDDSFLSDLTTVDDDNVFSDMGSDGAGGGMDIWLDPDTAVAPEKPRFYTWDSFLVEGGNTPVNGFITEEGPELLDAALVEAGEEGTVVATAVFCDCLLHLGLGRSSVLFSYDRRSQTFNPVREKLRISGCTAGTIESIIETFAECGTNVKKLERFAHVAYQDSSSFSPALIALAQCTTTIIESIQKRLSTSRSSIRSVLHLHSLIREPALIVDTFVRLTQATEGFSDDSQLLSRLFDAVQQQQHRSGWLKPLLVETLARTTRPWLEFVEQWIGLDEGPGGLGVAGLVRKGGFVGVEETSELDETGKERTVKNYIFEKSRVPSFISTENAEMVFEIGRSLRYLEKFHPRHPLSTPATTQSAAAPRLHWKFSWQDLEDLQTQAQAYERDLRAAIQKYTLAQKSIFSKDDPVDLMDVDLVDTATPSGYSFEIFGRSKEQMSETLVESMEAMNRNLPSIEATSQDSLATMVLHLTRGDPESLQLTTFAPPLSITPILSFSNIFSAQARLINKACLRMFFKEHKVRQHLLLLRRFQLFGDGVFSSRLAHALFDADLDTTERQAGVQRTGGTMGLKLGSRDTWPPASSELRLALMDVLTESFSGESGVHSAGKTGELPGGLSFAVREMSDEELEACMDPNGISALDFLRLEYKPPSPLEAVITPTAMYRYDRIFKLLLRVLRMVFVVNTLWRDANSRSTKWNSVDPISRKFGIEARHFVTTLASYMLESGIGTTWRRFESKLRELEKDLDSGRGGAGEDESLDRLRAYHESTLDRIMFATLSRKRQQPVMKIVDEIFAIILKFAHISHLKATGQEIPPTTSTAPVGGLAFEEEETTDGNETERLYRSFKRRVGIFISVCRGLSEKRGYGDGRKDLEGRRGAVDGTFGTGYKEEANLLGMLLLGLEMSGYYSVGVRRRR